MSYSILFDMDGVLVDSEPVINEAALRGLAEYGVHAKPEDFIPFVGTGEDLYIGGVSRKYNVPYQVEMKHRVYQIYLEIVSEKIKIFDGVLELLLMLKEKGIKAALASSADKVKIYANLKAASIPVDLFEVIISGEDVVHKKPSPDIYLLAADRIFEKYEDCIVVEDALNGIVAAKAAGMKCIAVSTSFSAAELSKEEPDWI
ncbi:MAG: HAD-IA family hydrolase, partial [Vallitaleaceae bacterium]|nr:HAD-IA family hydrolase [Vallitaleaceae bacterium]